MRISAIFYFRSKMFVLELKTAKRGKVALGGPRLGNRETGQARAEVVEQGPEVFPVPVCGCGFLEPNGVFLSGARRPGLFGFYRFIFPENLSQHRSIKYAPSWPFCTGNRLFWFVFLRFCYSLNRKPHPENID